jgi:hypothetical protein
VHEYSATFTEKLNKLCLRATLSWGPHKLYTTHTKKLQQFFVDKGHTIKHIDGPIELTVHSMTASLSNIDGFSFLKNSASLDYYSFCNPPGS